MRMIYSVQSLWRLKKSVRGGFSYKDYLQAGKSVAGIHAVEPVAEIVRRFRVAAERAETTGTAAQG
jgi:nitronate monooxygenase